ncbi:MAG: hypothetical protein ACLRFH_03790 [Opitutales bacterium]
MAVSSVNSINTTNNTSVEAYKKEYEALNKTWTDKYSTNAYLSSDFKVKMADMLKKLEGLVNVSKEEKMNEEIAKLIASLTAIINGSDSMMNLDQRISCLTALANFQKSTKSKDITTNECNNISNILNNTEFTYSDEARFYQALYSSILDNYSNKIDQNTKNAIQDLIRKKDKYIDSFYSNFMSTVLSSNKENLYSQDHTTLSNTTYESIADFLNALAPALANYSFYKIEQDNSSSATRANLSNQTISMKVMQESNAYKLLEIDNLVNEALAKRAEMDPAMKRLRDGVYWGDNKEIKPQESIKPEDELWTKKQE